MGGDLSCFLEESAAAFALRARINASCHAVIQKPRKTFCLLPLEVQLHLHDHVVARHIDDQALWMTVP
jgi:hypothetical protein